MLAFLVISVVIAMLPRNCRGGAKCREPDVTVAHRKGLRRLPLGESSIVYPFLDVKLIMERVPSRALRCHSLHRNEDEKVKQRQVRPLTG